KPADRDAVVGAHHAAAPSAEAALGGGTPHGIARDAGPGVGGVVAARPVAPDSLAVEVPELLGGAADDIQGDLANHPPALVRAADGPERLLHGVVLVQGNARGNRLVQRLLFEVR